MPTLCFELMQLEEQKTAHLEHQCERCGQSIEHGGGFQCHSCLHWYHVRCAGKYTLPNCKYCAENALPPGGM